MAVSHDVKLPRDQRPVFPDRCVVCLRSRPRSAVAVSDRSFTWWSLVPLVGLFTWGRKDKLEAPACAPCGRALTRAQIGWTLLQSILVLAAILIGVFLKPFGDSRWAFAGLLVGAIAVAVALKIFFPPAFGLDSWEKAITYEFRDEAYASEFAALNEGEVE